MKTVLLGGVALIMLVSGCASAPRPEAKLWEARTLIGWLSTRSGCAGPVVDDAQGALDYAVLEDRVSPGHPLAGYRADTALRKAQRAEAACMRTAQR